MKVAQPSPTLCDPMDYTAHGILQARILEWDSPFLLKGIFPTQGLNPGLPHCRQILYQLSYKRSPQNIESNVNYFIHVVHYIHSSNVSYKWNFVHFDWLHSAVPISTPPPLPAFSNYKSNLSMSLLVCLLVF